MRAALLSIGDELVLGQSLDTNTRWMADRLGALGVPCEEHRTVPDDRGIIARAMRDLLDGRDLLVVTGGLGPTADDLTRFALADVLDPDAPPVIDDDLLADVERWFVRRPDGMPPANRVQAMRPPRAEGLRNPQGTAPGLRAMLGPDGPMIACLPGPPREMRPMFERAVEPWVRERAASDLHTAIVASVGLGESDAAERLGDLMDRDRDPLVGTTASGGIVRARIRTTGPGAAERLAATEAEVRRRWAPFAFGTGDATLEAVVGERLAAAGRRLVTVESCTGGGLGAAITAVPGSSAWYRGGWVTYEDAVKQAQVDVPTAALVAHGAVSAPVAACMAVGGLRRGTADEAISITGIAGPGGGTAEKPVGTVWIGQASADPQVPGGCAVRARCFRFRGERAAVRSRTITVALALLRLSLDGAESTLGTPPRVPLLWEVPEATAAARPLVAEVMAAGDRDEGPA